VSTQQTLIKIVKWMINDEAERGKPRPFARVIKEFSGDFRGSSNANFMKASRYKYQSIQYFFFFIVLTAGRSRADRESTVQIARTRKNLCPSTTNSIVESRKIFSRRL